MLESQTKLGRRSALPNQTVPAVATNVVRRRVRVYKIHHRHNEHYETQTSMVCCRALEIKSSMPPGLNVLGKHFELFIDYLYLIPSALNSNRRRRLSSLSCTKIRGSLWGTPLPARTVLTLSAYLALDPQPYLPLVDSR